MPPRPQEHGTGSNSRENGDGAPSLGDALMGGVFACIPQQDQQHRQKEKKPQGGTVSKEKEEGEKQDEAWEEKKEAELRTTGYVSIGICIFMFCYGKIMVEARLPPDPRQEGWILMMSPIPPLVLSIIFVICMTMIGPRYMHGRKPLAGFKKFMVVYNIIQVIFSTWIFSMLVRGGWFTGYSFQCELCDYSNKPQAVMMLHGGYWYYASKYVDFFDTFFMVINKKYNQITPLHVIHHSVMTINIYFGIHYMPGGHSTFLCLLNSFVHIVMYFYYGLSSLGPWIRPYLWWKKHLTKLQIAQFVGIIVHASQLAFIDCAVPSVVTFYLAGSTWMFLYLFVDFYVKAYLKKRERKNEISKSDSQIQGAEATDSKTEITPLTSEEISTITRREHNRVATPRAA